MPVPKKPFAQLISLLVFSVILCGACQLLRPQPSEERRFLPGLESVVVVGFQAAISERDEPRAVRSPITGAVFSSAPVSAAKSLRSFCYYRNTILYAAIWAIEFDAQRYAARC